MANATARIVTIDPDSPRYIDDLGAYRAHCGRCGYDLGHIRYGPDGPSLPSLSTGWRKHDDGIWRPVKRMQNKRARYLKETQQGTPVEWTGQGQKMATLRGSTWPYARRKQRRTDEYREKIRSGTPLRSRAHESLLPLDMKCPRCPTINHVPLPDNPPENLPW